MLIYMHKHSYILVLCVCMRTYVCMFAYVFICMCSGQNLTLIKMMTCVLPAISATPSHPRASHRPKDISVRESHSTIRRPLYLQALSHQGLSHSEGPSFEPEALANRSFIISFDTYVTLSSFMFMTCNTQSTRTYIDRSKFSGMQS